MAALHSHAFDNSGIYEVLVLVKGAKRSEEAFDRLSREMFINYYAPRSKEFHDVDYISRRIRQMGLKADMEAIFGKRRRTWDDVSALIPWDFFADAEKG